MGNGRTPSLHPYEKRLVYLAVVDDLNRTEKLYSIQ